jgi:hypothetical protein
MLKIRINICLLRFLLVILQSLWGIIYLSYNLELGLERKLIKITKELLSHVFLLQQSNIHATFSITESLILREEKK